MSLTCKMEDVTLPKATWLHQAKADWVRSMWIPVQVLGLLWGQRKGIWGISRTNHLSFALALVWYWLIRAFGGNFSPAIKIVPVGIRSLIAWALSFAFIMQNLKGARTGPLKLGKRRAGEPSSFLYFFLFVIINWCCLSFSCPWGSALPSCGLTPKMPFWESDWIWWSFPLCIPHYGNWWCYRKASVGSETLRPDGSGFEIWLDS